MGRLTLPGVAPFNPTDLLVKHDRLGAMLGIELFVQHDDFIPALMGGNKWVKLAASVGEGAEDTVYITNGGVGSNHCKAMAVWAATFGRRCHLVLHGSGQGTEQLSLNVLETFGASWEIVEPHAISATIDRAGDQFRAAGCDVVVIPGGAHSREGAMGYSAYAQPVIKACRPAVVVHASGTGGTQAGIVHAAHRVEAQDTRIVGVSVARPARRGAAAVRAILEELGMPKSAIDFRDDFRGGGYGLPAPGATDSILLAASHGLLLDQTYTGKAFDGLISMVKTGEIAPGTRVLFWHTGGTFLGLMGSH